jgi:hypothetical protein
MQASSTSTTPLLATSTPSVRSSGAEKNLSPSVTTTGHSPLLFKQSERPLALEPVSFFHILCTHPLPLNSPVDTVRTAFAAASTTDKVDNGNEYDTDDTDDTADDNDEPPPAIMVTTNKKTPTAAAAASTKKSGVDEITSVLNKTKVSVSASMAPAVPSYSTKVFNPFLIRLVTDGGEQFLEFDVSLAATFMCEDGIVAVLLPDGMSVSLQRGVYASFFTTRRLRKDLGDKYNKDSSRVTAHQKVCDEFKKKETVQAGLVYGEIQIVQLPCQYTGLVEQTYIGNVPTGIIIPVNIVREENGMEIKDEELHTQFVTNTTFRVKTVDQVEKEKKAA